METTFKIWKTNREKYLQFLENYSLEQLNKIPEGLNNNLIWNIGHIIVTQQGLVYRLSGLPINVSDEMMHTYKNGSKPTANATQEDVNEIKLLLFSLMNQTKSDFETGKFQTYTEYTTQMGFNLTSAKEALEFNNYHEAIHLGVMMSIKKFI